MRPPRIVPRPRVGRPHAPASADQRATGSLVELVRRAWDRRAPLRDIGETSAYRLINGAGDGVPGVTVDYYGGALVANFYDDSVQDAVLCEALVQTVPCVTAIYGKRRPRSLSRLSAAQTAALAPAAPLWGVARPDLIVRENGLRFEVRPGDGLSTGLFLDMRDTRAMIRSRAQARTVLNLFAYTCAFGVAALTGGAERVLNIDASRRVLEWGRRNYAHNHLVVDDYDFVYGEAFDWLRRLSRRRTQFDLVICDPPSFSSVKGRAFSVARQYGELVAATLPLLPSGGLLLCCANEAGLKRDAFRAICLQSARAAGRTARIVHAGGASRIDHPQTAGRDDPLKVILLDV